VKYYVVNFYHSIFVKAENKEKAEGEAIKEFEASPPLLEDMTLSIETVSKKYIENLGLA